MRLRLEHFTTGAGDGKIEGSESRQLSTEGWLGSSGHSPSPLPPNGTDNTDEASDPVSATSPAPANLTVTDLSKRLHDERVLRDEMKNAIEIHVMTPNAWTRNVDPDIIAFG